MKNESGSHISRESIPDDMELINYLHDKLSAEEKRKVEEMITDDLLIGDAVEGLQQLGNKDSLNEVNSSLNKMIDKKLAKKKKAFETYWISNVDDFTGNYHFAGSTGRICIDKNAEPLIY